MGTATEAERYFNALSDETIDQHHIAESLPSDLESTL